MKNLILSLLVVTFAFGSCNTKMKEEGTTSTHMMKEGAEMMNGDTKMKDYACSMHPEMEGMKGDKCPKCNMEMTKKTNKEMKIAIYACPMHPEVQGELNDKCSKCGMPLTEPVADKTVK